LELSQSIKLIGIGDNGQESLLPQYAQWIEESEVLVGGERILSFFPNYSGKKIAIKGGLKKVVEQLQDETRPTVVLASGDPLFYGMGGYLSSKINMEVYDSACFRKNGGKLARCLPRQHSWPQYERAGPKD
jgi:precorrin-6Y C5,15-methyltransferase (decarboxylating)